MTIFFRTTQIRFLVAGLIVALQPAIVVAQEVTGTWMRSTSDAKVRFSQCGDALCGVVSWVKDPAHAKDVGLKVFYDMKPTAPNAWGGQAFNPEDGRTYSGRMVLTGDVLTTSGCVLGGLICKSVVWSRSP